MAKALRTAALVASAAALVAAGVALANPGLTIAGVKVATIATAASIAATTATAGATVLDKPRNERQGLQLQFKIDPGAPVPIVFGRTMVGGTVVHRAIYGTSDSYETFFVVLSGAGPIDAIETLTVDKANVAFSGGTAIGYFANWMWSDTQLGATPETGALTSGITVAPFGTAGQPTDWTAAHKLSGYAAASWSLLYDTKSRRYANGEPAPAWVVRGLRCYDPRKDSTRPGGSGPQRWAEPSSTVAHAAARATWAYTDTPAIVGLMWRLGIWQRDESDAAARYQKITGIGAPIDLLDLAAITNAANIQEANGWKLGGEVTSEQDRWEVLKLIEEAGGCEPISVGAMMSTLIRAPRVPLRTITEADLAPGKLTAPAMRARSERINGYRAKFRSEPHGWEMTAIDIVQVPGLVAEDGRARTGSGDFSLVTDPDQCASLAAYAVYDTRELEPIVMSLKPFAAAYRLGDCLTLTLPELGLINRDAIVRSRSIDPATGIVTMTFRTETAAKHATCLGQTGSTPPTPRLSTSEQLDAAAAQAASPPRAAYQLVRRETAYPLTSTANVIQIPASFDARIDDNRLITFPAGEITGLEAGTSYLVFYALDDVVQTLTGTDGEPLIGGEGQPLTTTILAGTYFVGLGAALEESGFSGAVMIRDIVTMNEDGSYPVGETPPPSDGGGGYGGGGNCVTVDSLVLMADGSWRQAGDLRPGDMVRTQHECTLAWGDHEVTAVSIHVEPVFTAIGYPTATARHRFWMDGAWAHMEAIGSLAGLRDVARITVDGAHTYVARHPDEAIGRLSHNLKPVEQQA